MSSIDYNIKVGNDINSSIAVVANVLFPNQKIALTEEEISRIINRDIPPHIKFEIFKTTLRLRYNEKYGN